MTLLNINRGAQLIYQFSNSSLITDILVSVLSNVLIHRIMLKKKIGFRQ